MAMERSYNNETAYVIINGNKESGTASVPKGKYVVAYSNKEKEEKVSEPKPEKKHGEVRFFKKKD